jgi:Flp pilus assembly protein TadD
MMKRNGILRPVLTSLALALGAACALTLTASAQETGGDLGSGAGIFRPKNPETTRRRPTTTNVKPPTTHRTNETRTTALPPEVIEERYEDALNEGNEARDARKYVEAEKAYRNAAQLKAKDFRAWYGLGNVYTDQQRWDDAEKAYKQASVYASQNADIYLALSYVQVQPRAGGSNASRLVEAEQDARRAIQLQPTSAIAYDHLGVARLDGHGDRASVSSRHRA